MKTTDENFIVVPKIILQKHFVQKMRFSLGKKKFAALLSRKFAQMPMTQSLADIYSPVSKEVGDESVRDT
jgi:2,3-bisphosphoglycerate-independent phosphoglycerate mutase